MVRPLAVRFIRFAAVSFPTVRSRTRFGDVFRVCIALGLDIYPYPSWYLYRRRQGFRSISTALCLGLVPISYALRTLLGSFDLMEERDEKQTVLDRNGRAFVLASGHRCQCCSRSEIESLDAERYTSCGSDITGRGQLDRHQSHAQMGLGFGWDIYPRACLHAGSVGLSSRPIVTERSG